MAHNFVTKEPTVAVFVSGEFFWPSDCFSFAALKKNCGSTALVGLDLLIVEVTKSHPDTPPDD
jgi:hypothetical protein